ncbi:hypothetical protein Vi05172_g2331 [Venturia inaequalis]|nr:hypothetical protein Vi05172_g2331 [Venturia inaequalis]
MKFAVITALYLASGAAGRPTDPNQDPAYVPKPGDGSYTVCTPYNLPGICKRYKKDGTPTKYVQKCRAASECLVNGNGCVMDIGGFPVANCSG